MPVLRGQIVLVQFTQGEHLVARIVLGHDLAQFRDKRIDILRLHNSRQIV